MQKKRILSQPQIKSAAELWLQLARREGAEDRYLKGFFLKHRKRFGSRDRRFISDVIYSALRHKLYLKAWQDFLVESKRLKIEDGLEGFLILAGYLAGCATKEDVALWVEAPEKILSAIEERELPREADLKGDTARLLSLKFSYPDWMIARWLEAFGEEYLVEILMGLETRPKTILRVNTLKTTSEKLLDSLVRQGIEAAPAYRVPTAMMIEGRVNLQGLGEFKRGAFEVQDQGSQLICQLVSPSKAASVWDVCSGGGGKTLALAALMENKGAILATDIRESSLVALKKRMKRAGVKNTKVALVESDLRFADNQTDDSGDFDIVFVDAPCSGVGTLRRNPGAKWRIHPGDFEAYAEKQLTILREASKKVKPGGELYYVTCSIDPAENKGVVDNFISEESSFELENLPGESSPYLELWPHEFESDGFFMAKMVKKQL